jgi:Uma2 family endonuclease
MTTEEFLGWLERQEERYELVDGRPRPMTGGTRAHRLVSRNALAALHAALRGKPCQALDEFAVVTAAGNVRYPDVLVDCGKGRLEDHVAASPTVVIEVASPNSIVADYLEKPRDYASIGTISTYVILSQDAIRAAVLRRIGSELVVEGEAIGRDSGIDLPEIGVRLALADAYDGLDLRD